MRRLALVAVGVSGCFLEIAPLDLGGSDAAGASGGAGGNGAQGAGAGNACDGACPLGTEAMGALCRLAPAAGACGAIAVGADSSFQGNFCDGFPLPNVCGEPDTIGYVFEVACDAEVSSYEATLTASPAAGFVTQLGEACGTSEQLGCSHGGSPPPTTFQFSAADRVAIVAPADACDEEFIVVFAPRAEP